MLSSQTGQGEGGGMGGETAEGGREGLESLCQLDENYSKEQHVSE